MHRSSLGASDWQSGDLASKVLSEDPLQTPSGLFFFPFQQLSFDHRRHHSTKPTSQSLSSKIVELKRQPH